MRTALFPGTFDPFHNGHLEVVERAARLFDEVVVAAMRNPQKGQSLFDLDERQAIIGECVEPVGNVRIVALNGLVVDVARDVGAVAIVRGLRAVSDFETEMQMAQMNHRLSGIDTLFIPTSPAYAYVAAKLIREVALYGGDVAGFVPDPVLAHLNKKLGR